jgi:hypothetical protein
MSKDKSGKATHDEEEARVEGVRQSAIRAAGVSQATVKTAEIAYYRAALASAIANGLERGVFIGALWELGVRDV